MAANIDMSNGRANIAYVGQKPWHGLGTEITDFDVARNAYRMKTAAGLDWEPYDVPLFYFDPNSKTYVQMDRHKGRLRSDNNGQLGVVGNGHTAWSNEAMFKWFEPFLDAGLLRFETAGSLDGGRIVWALTKTDTVQDILPGDAVETFLAASNGHDGSHSVRLGFTRIRIVCVNTLEAAIRDAASKMLRYRHGKNVATEVEKLREVINLQRMEFEATADQYRLLAGKNINMADLKKYVKLVVDAEESDDELSTRMKNIIDKIVEFHEVGKGSDIAGVRGTYWGAYNAVSEWLTWDRGHNADTRLKSLWFGPSKTMNQKAFDTALSLATSA